MTDKLVEQLRDEDSYYRVQEKHWCIDHEELERQRLAAANRIIAQAAEIERLERSRSAWEDEARRYAGNAEYWQTETERLREAGNDLGFYAGHEDACDCVKGWAKGPCNCGYTEAWQAWHSLAGKAEQ